MLKFLDCEIGVGRTAFNYSISATPAEALAVMDHYAIESALVYDRGSHESGRFDRFDFILDFCRHSPRLLPTIPIVPPATGEQPPPNELVDAVLSAGIKSVRACPAAHNFLFNVFSMGKLLEVLQRHRVPVVCTSMQMQDHPWNHASDWANLAEVAHAFPDLPLVVLYSGWLEGRRLLPLLENCPNVLADLGCVSFQYLQLVAQRLGSERLVMASHLPCDDPALYTTWVNYCGLDERARRNIAGDNMRRLLEAVR